MPNITVAKTAAFCRNLSNLRVRKRKDNDSFTPDLLIGLISFK